MCFGKLKIQIFLLVMNLPLQEDEMKRGKNGSKLFISGNCLQNADVP